MKKTVNQIQLHLHNNNDTTDSRPCQVYNPDYLNHNVALNSDRQHLWHASRIPPSIPEPCFLRDRDGHHGRHYHLHAGPISAQALALNMVSHCFVVVGIFITCLIASFSHITRRIARVESTPPEDRA